LLLPLHITHSATAPRRGSTINASISSIAAIVQILPLLVATATAHHTLCHSTQRCDDQCLSQQHSHYCTNPAVARCYCHCTSHTATARKGATINASISSRQPNHVFTDPAKAASATARRTADKSAAAGASAARPLLLLVLLQGNRCAWCTYFMEQPPLLL